MTIAVQTGLPSIDMQTASMAEVSLVRASHWAAQSDRGLEILRYKPALAILDHSELEKGPSFQRRLDDIGIVDGRIRELWDLFLVTTEGAMRKRLRIPLASLFRPAQMTKLQQSIRGLINQALDEIPDRSCVDFMQAFAWKIPPQAYCTLVSAPIELAPTVARLSDSVLAPLLTADPSRRQESVDAFFEGWDFVKEHIDARRKNLGNDFTSIMIKQQMEGLLTEDELIVEGMSILQASIDNTVHQLGLTVGTLLEEPDRWRQVVENPDLIPAAIEEVIRYRPRFGTIFRYARKPVQFEGIEIPENSWVFVSVRSANRDEAQFEEPNAFKLSRKSGRALMFGGGPYNCLGQTLARLELNESLRILVARFPDMRMIGEWARHDSNAVTETRHLQVALR